MCPGPDAPISSTRWRVDSSAVSTVRGRPTSLLKESLGATVGASAESTCRSRSFVVVFPTDPVTATTSMAPPARSASRWARARSPRAPVVSPTTTWVIGGQSDRSTTRSTRAHTAPARAADAT